MPAFTPEEKAKLLQGDRFCVGCGELCIPKTAQEWMNRCKPCFRDEAWGHNCTHCGNAIEMAVQNWCRDRGRIAQTCRDCAYGMLKGRKKLLEMVCWNEPIPAAAL